MMRQEDDFLKPLPHHYEVHLTGGASGHGQLSAEGMPELRTRSPVEFGGEKACLVSAPLSTPIRLEPEIVDG